MSDRMPEDMPDRMPEGMPDKMSDRMPEDLPVTKRIDVMVGITRSKVICFFLSQVNVSYFNTPNLVELCQVYSLPSHFMGPTCDQKAMCKMDYTLI